MFAEAYAVILQDELDELIRFALEQPALASRVAKAGPKNKGRLTARLRELVERFGSQVAAAARPFGGGVKTTPSDIQRLDQWRDWSQRIAQRLTDLAAQRVLRIADSELGKDPGASGLLGRIRTAAGEDLIRGPGAIMASRNVVATATTLGKEVAYDQNGIVLVEWLAFSRPQWPRRHDLLDGKIQPRGQLWDMPRSRHKLRWPHDPQGHVSEVINCRCSTAPIVPGTRKWEAYRKANPDWEPGGGSLAPITAPALARAQDTLERAEGEAQQQRLDLATATARAEELQKQVRDLSSQQIAAGSPAEDLSYRAEATAEELAVFDEAVRQEGELHERAKRARAELERLLADYPEIDVGRVPSVPDLRKRKRPRSIEESSAARQQIAHSLNDRVSEAVGGWPGPDDTEARRGVIRDATKEEAEVLVGVTLFTGGNFQTVRDPNKWDESKAGGTVRNPVWADDSWNDDGAPGEVQNSLENYKIAHRAMRDLARARNRTFRRPIYRGLDGVSEKKIELWRRRGYVSDREIASWSADKDKAFGGNVMLVCENPTRGTYVAPISTFGDLEDEFVSGGKYRIKRVNKSKGLYTIYVEMED